MEGNAAVLRHGRVLCAGKLRRMGAERRDAVDIGRKNGYNEGKTRRGKFTYKKGYFATA